MYNSENKKKFLDTLMNSNTIKIIIGIFNSTEAYESSINKDLCQMNSEELAKTLESTIGVSDSARKSRLVYIRKYINWCLKNDIPGAQNEMSHIDLTGIVAMKSRTVTSPFHLEQYLNILFPTPDKETVSDIYRCYYWLAYAGMNIDDIFEVCVNDVHLDSMTVIHNDRLYNLYGESARAFYNCVNLDSFVFNHPKYIQISRRPRAEGELLLRGFANPVKETFTRESARRATECINLGLTNIRISYKDARLSGICYRAFVRENAGLDLGFDDIATIDAEGLYQDGDTPEKLDYIYHRKTSLYKDYKVWKQTLI